MINKQLRIAELISRHLSGEITPDEASELKAWRGETSDHEALFQRVCSTQNLAHYYQESAKFDREAGWKSVDKKIRTARRKQILLQWSRYAALFLLPVALGVLLYAIRPRPEQSVAEQIQNQPTEILPGERKAVLTLGDGQTVELRENNEKMMKEKDGTSINIDSEALNYQTTTTDTKSVEEIFNKVEIPHGGEYTLKLSDGTLIYLNSMTSLRFPVRFVGEKRVVELDGEGYFKVAKSSKPFIVKTNNIEVEVLGTDFNLSAYQGEECKTTLVNGSVRVCTNARNCCVLQPSEQACLKPGSEELSVRKVDVSLYTSWINGKIYFKDARLEDIIHSLSRWYDMDVFYADPSLKNLRFGCNVNRYTEITPFLELLEETEKVNITIKEKRITFKHK